MKIRFTPDVHSDTLSEALFSVQFLVPGDIFRDIFEQ